jgi:hypothetical protein
MILADTNHDLFIVTGQKNGPVLIPFNRITNQSDFTRMKEQARPLDDTIIFREEEQFLHYTDKLTGKFAFLAKGEFMDQSVPQQTYTACMVRKILSQAGPA